MQPYITTELIDAIRRRQNSTKLILKEAIQVKLRTTKILD